MVGNLNVVLKIVFVLRDPRSTILRIVFFIFFIVIHILQFKIVKCIIIFEKTNEYTKTYYLQGVNINRSQFFDKTTIELTMVDLINVQIDLDHEEVQIFRSFEAFGI